MTFDREGILDLLHLQRRRSGANRVFSGLALFLGGSVVGAVVTALLTPKTGRELRGNLRELTENFKETTVDPIIHRVQEQAGMVSPKV